MSGMSAAEWGPEAVDDGAYLDQLMQDDLHYEADEWAMEPLQLLKTEPSQFVDVTDAMAHDLQQIMPPMNGTPLSSGIEYSSPSHYSDSGDDAAQRVRSMSITSSSSASSSVQHGNSSSTSSSTSYASVAHMTPYERKQHSLMLRRKRNRESMRRSRLRDKETLTTLKDTVAALEQKYTQLTSVEHRGTAPDQAAHFVQLQDKLSRVIQAKRHLETERQAFETKLQANQDLIQEVTQIVDECQLDDAVAEKLALLEGQNPHLSDAATADETTAASASNATAQPKLHEYGFVPLPEPALDHLIAVFCENVQRVKTAGFPLHQPSAEIFGWTARRHVDEQNHMHFEFAKSFKEFTAWELIKRTWLDATDLVKYRQAAGRSNLRRLDFLQRVSNDVCVVVRELVHPVDKKIFRTHYVIFWKETKDGYFFGLHSINPKTDDDQSSPEGEAQEAEGEQVLWIDVSASIEFVRRRFDLPPLDHPNALDLPTEYCEIRWQGKTNYKTPKLAAENAVEYLMGLLKWENSIVGPRFHLTAG